MDDNDIFNQATLQSLYRYSYALCMNNDNAYDLLHHALEKYIKTSQKSSKKISISYIRKTIRNAFIDEYRQSKRHPSESYDDENMFSINESSLEDVVIAQIDLEIIWPMLDLIDREILFYWAVEDMSAQQIAEELDKPRGTILSRIYRLRVKVDALDMIGDQTGGMKP